ncbi:acetate kinase [Sinorhizobium medicae]|nr:acetate kinase [Sinorhizobium medicae]
MEAVLVVNAGSSSLKFQIFGIAGGGLQRQVRGKIDGIGTHPHLKASNADGTDLVDRALDSSTVRDLPTAIAEARSYQHLAPLHQPNNLAPIRLAMDINPDVPQVACFDTAFHRGRAEHTDCYALPHAFYEDGIRRYGFHGLSYEYIAERLREVAPDIAGGRVIVAHLGSGVSMCALKDGRSVETTMGFTALDGLPMGTRPGQLDPGVILYLLTHHGMSAQEISDLLYHDAGLKGLSGISNDMRELSASEDPRASFAIDHFVHRCSLHAGMLAAALGGLDAFVFTAGIGENSATVRARIAERLDWLGAELDAKANDTGAPVVSRAGSRVSLHVIPTDEELMIARHTLALLRV